MISILILMSDKFTSVVVPLSSEQFPSSLFACFGALSHRRSQFVSQQKWVKVAVLRKNTENPQSHLMPLHEV